MQRNKMIKMKWNYEVKHRKHQHRGTYFHRHFNYHGIPERMRVLHKSIIIIVLSRLLPTYRGPMFTCFGVEMIHTSMWSHGTSCVSPHAFEAFHIMSTVYEFCLLQIRTRSGDSAKRAPCWQFLSVNSSRQTSTWGRLVTPRHQNIWTHGPGLKIPL